MAKTLTDAATWAAVQTPEPGDDVTADLGNAGDVQEAFQRLMNRDRFLLARSAPWELPAAVSCADGAKITVQGAASLDANYAIASADITPNALGANKWYYLYAASGGTLSVSETVPDAAAVASSADASLRYLGCFRTDGASAIIPFAASRGKYHWFAPISVLSFGTSGSWASVSLTAQVPPHARQVTLLVKGDSSATTGNETFSIRSSLAPTASDGNVIICPGAYQGNGGASTYNGKVTTSLTVALDSATKAVQYKRNAAGLGITLEVAGYDE